MDKISTDFDVSLVFFWYFSTSIVSPFMNLSNHKEPGKEKWDCEFG